jgi:hypothetical protein
MDLKIALMIAPGEAGVAETHSWRLKEVQTVEQAVEFLMARISPFLGAQTSLENAPARARRKRGEEE